MKRYFRNILKTFALAAGLIVISANACAYDARIHCQEDTLKVSKMLEQLSAQGGSFGQRVVNAAHLLEGIPYAQGADNDSVGTIVINLHSTDRLGFINTALALAEASQKQVPTVREFVNCLESYSRRHGEDNGFASQMFYGADWVVDNVYRGNMKEMTEYLGGGGSKTKTLDYMTRHKDNYPAMKNPEVYDKVRMMEMGYRSHRIPHLKKQSAGNKPLHELLENGDIIIMLSPEIDYDLYDIGIVEMKDGEPYLIHVSHENNSVVADPYTMQRLFKLENQHFYGYRWLRPIE